MSYKKKSVGEKSSLQFLLSYSIHSVSLKQRNCLFGSPVIRFQLWLYSNVAWGETLQRQSLFTHWACVQGLTARSQTHYVMSLVSNFSEKREEAAGPYLYEPWPMRNNFVVHLHAGRNWGVHVMLCILHSPLCLFCLLPLRGPRWNIVHRLILNWTKNSMSSVPDSTFEVRCVFKIQLV